MKDGRCENAYLEERTKVVVIDGLPTSIQCKVRIFYGREQETHLLETAFEAGTLEKQTRQLLRPVVTQIERSGFDRGLQTSPVAVTKEKIRGQMPRTNNQQIQKQNQGDGLV